MPTTQRRQSAAEAADCVVRHCHCLESQCWPRAGLHQHWTSSPTVRRKLLQHQNLKAGRAQNDAKAEPVCDKSLGAPQRNLSKGIAQKGQWRWEHQTHLLLRPTFSQGKLGDLKSCTLMPAKEKDPKERSSHCTAGRAVGCAGSCQAAVLPQLTSAAHGSTQSAAGLQRLSHWRQRVSYADTSTAVQRFPNRPNCHKEPVHGPWCT